MKVRRARRQDAERLFGLIRELAEYEGLSEWKALRLEGGALERLAAEGD